MLEKKTIALGEFLSMINSSVGHARILYSIYWSTTIHSDSIITIVSLCTSLKIQCVQFVMEGL